LYSRDAIAYANAVLAVIVYRPMSVRHCVYSLQVRVLLRRLT